MNVMPIPVIDNTICFFINNILYKLYNDKDDSINLLFDFKEKEAKEFIKEIYDKYAADSQTYNDFRSTFFDLIDNPHKDGFITIPVYNYSEFFENLNEVYSLELDKYGEYNELPYGYARITNFFLDLWLRGSNLDYLDVNRFLELQIEMYRNDLFKDYRDKKFIGSFSEELNIPITCENKVSNTWDEAPYEMIFKLYDRYKLDRSVNPNYYELPKIRYGIFERNGEYVARISSIQRDLDDINEDNYVKKACNKLKYKIVDNDFDGIEPNKVISLFMFFNMLKSKGITKVVFPTMLIFDYPYHVKRSIMLDRELKDNWTEHRIECDPYRYQDFKEYYDRSYGKEEIISKIKTEDLIKTALKASSYIDSSSIRDIDNEISIDLSNFEYNDINNPFLRDINISMENTTHDEFKSKSKKSKRFS